MKNPIKTYAIGIAIPLAVGGLAAFLTRESMDIYDTINTPPLAPPGILFPIVWTILYVLMGIGSVLVLEGVAPADRRRSALALYGIQLVVNFFWSILFFEKQAFLFSFVWLCLLWVLIVAMLVSFRRISRPAAWLQIPYLLWVSFAGYLNLAIYLLNP